MAGRYLTDMADVLRAAGLNVIEEPGWQTRARSSGGYQGDKPYAIMWHHTASKTTPINDIVYMIRNSDSRPIGNIYLARNGDVHLLAAGAANTNGKGGPLAFSKGTVPLDLMNTHSIAIEAANDGVGEQWPQVQIDAYFKVNNALAPAYGMQVTDLASHNLWAPTRKIDPAKAASVQGPWKPSSVTSAGTWSTLDIRAEATRRSVSQPPPPVPWTPPPVHFNPEGLSMIHLTEPPVRIYDSRGGGKVDGSGPIVADFGGGKAAFINVTVVDADAPGFLKVWAGAEPETSVLNYEPGEAICNTTLVGINGDLFMVRTSSACHLIVDLLASVT